MKLNRAMRRAAKSKRGGKQYMQSSKDMNANINKIFVKGNPGLRKSMRNKGSTFKAFNKNTGE
jgi:hypothetical protein